MCGDDFLGDSGHVPRHHKCDDVSHWESSPAYRGMSEPQDIIAMTTVYCSCVCGIISCMCVISSPGRDHSQHLQQYCESGPHPVDGPGLHCIG